MTAHSARTPAPRTLPWVSVVVPVYNGGTDLAKCLAAIAASNYPAFDCIVVDDGSTDGMVEFAAARHGARVIRLDCSRGPASARNRGAEQARGDILFFTDADVVLHRDSVATAVGALQSDPGLSAVFGSYDDAPEHASFFSQYRNLYHHWVHQNGNEEAFTFWTGCGAIRRAVYLEMGGLEESFRQPSIEDIELGSRLRKRGHRIRLEKRMFGKHLKQWTFWNLLKTDLLRRGVPWVRLLMQERKAPLDLNLDLRTRLATVLAGLLAGSLAVLSLSGHTAALLPAVLFVLAIAASARLFGTGVTTGLAGLIGCVPVVIAPMAAYAVWPDPWAAIPLALLGGLIGMESAFYRYLARTRGILFALAVVPMRLLFFWGCIAAIPLGIINHLLARQHARPSVA